MSSEGSHSQPNDPTPASAVVPSDHILDCWLESVSYLPSFLDDTNDINTYPWWIPPDDDFSHESLPPPSTTVNLNHLHHGTTSATMAAATPQSLPPPSVNNTFHLIQPETKFDQPPQVSNNLPRKRKLGQEKKTQSCDDHHQDSSSGGGGGDASALIESGGGKKGGKQSQGNNGNGGSNKEGRWAEQLLNPCAAAITAGNFSRVQHLLYVLHELSSLTGSANHRLAAYGLRALTHHLSASNSSPAAAAPTGSITFAATESRFFQKSLLKFYEVSPWFSFPNKIANASILQILGQEIDPLRNLHILDIGVSHGVQWPTLLEALTRRSGGPPPLVRITMVTAAIEGSSDQISEPPFSIGPPGDNFASRLLCFAKSMNINLQINRLESRPLQNLNPQVISKDGEEILVVCAQFRLHHLNHNNPDERSEFLRVLRSLEPKGVILSENNMDCSCNGCVDYSSGFSRRVEYLWRFLDSTSSAFKGRESEERRMMEGEAAKALTNRGEMNERKEQWCERMRGVGFSGEGFCEDAIDEARALLRKHDNNWEMRVEEKDGFVGLWWKGQPVSFCSLWKLQGE
ncbi:Protein NODULATION SIGNALING PATHWAY 1 [Linum perenne]